MSTSMHKLIEMHVEGVLVQNGTRMEQKGHFAISYEKFASQLRVFNSNKLVVTSNFECIYTTLTVLITTPQRCIAGQAKNSPHFKLGHPFCARIWNVLICSVQLQNVVKNVTQRPRIF